MESMKQILLINKLLKSDTIEFGISLIKNNKTIKFIYNILIYIFLLLIFLFVSRVFIWYKIASGNLNYLGILTILFAFILDLILFKKIISVRSNWKTLFLKSSDVLSWEKAFRSQPFFWLVLVYLTFLSSLGVSMIPSFYKSNLLILFALTFFNTILTFEFFFILILFNLKWIGISHNYSYDSIKYKFTSSKIILFLILVILFFLGRSASEQINNFLLGATALDWTLFIITILIIFILLIYFLISLNTLIFKYFKLKYYVNIKNNIGIFILCTIFFINGVYLAKYIAAYIMYFNFEIPDPLIEMINQQNLKFNLPSFNDPIAIKLSIFLCFGFISIIFALVTYLIFLYYTFKKHSFLYCNFKSSLTELGLNFGRISTNQIDSPFERKVKKIIRKLLSTPLQNPSFIKNFSYFYYMFPLLSSLLFSLVITYILVRDSMFEKNTFFIFINTYDYYIGAACIFFILLTWIFEEVEKIHKYHITDFVNKNILYEYINYALIYTSIIISLLITIFVRDVYKIPLKYGGIVAPESIQVIQLSFFLITSGYILLKLSKKFEEKIIKAIEDEAFVSRPRY